LFPAIPVGQKATDNHANHGARQSRQVEDKGLLRDAAAAARQGIDVVEGRADDVARENAIAGREEARRSHPPDTTLEAIEARIVDDVKDGSFLVIRVLSQTLGLDAGCGQDPGFD
jgi:hypothetical protein